MNADEQEKALYAQLYLNVDDKAVRYVLADFLEEQGKQAESDAIRNGVVKKYGVDFRNEPHRNYGSPALTLDPDHIGSHPDGWTIEGEIHEDYYEWVNEFKASHPTYGLVWGDFESFVFASSEEAYQHFYQNHPPSSWDYWDI